MFKPEKKLLIGIDFDGTVVEFRFPEIGPPVIHALDVIHELQEYGHKLILWTVRGDQYLEDALWYLKANWVNLYGINKNPEQDNWSDSPKAHCDVYVDDLAMGCPLIKHVTGKHPPYVNWLHVRKHFVEMGALPKEIGFDTAFATKGSTEY